MNYRSYQDLVRESSRLAQALPRGKYCAVVGIPRSGMVPATIIALHLNIPCLDIRAMGVGRKDFSGRIQENETPRESFGCYLLVDDSCDSGTRMKEARSTIPWEVDTLAVYAHEGSRSGLTYYGELLPQPRIFQWNLYHHNHWTPRMASDIDGVVCHDPTMDETVDPAGYLNFLKNAVPLNLYTFPVAAFVSSRLEKYRKETAEWLMVNRQLFKELHLSPHSSAEDRRQHGDHALRKASLYSQHVEWSLFVESSMPQAKKIHAVSGKPVFCTDHGVMLGSL